MLDAKRIIQNIKPEKIVNLGNNYYYYNYDIQSNVVMVHYDDEDREETQYNFVQVKLYGKPDYERCVKEVIRAYVDANSEFDLINSFNAYQLGIADSVEEDYEEYLQLVKQIKVNVGKDFNKQLTTKVPTTPIEGLNTQLTSLNSQIGTLNTEITSLKERVTSLENPEPPTE